MTDQQLIRKYRIRFWVPYLIVLPAALAAMLWQPTNTWRVFLAVVLFLFFRRLIAAFSFGTVILPLLTEELDPARYLRVLEGAKLTSRSGIEQLNAAYYSGDRQTVVNLCNMQLSKPRLKKFFPQYWVMLARTAFEAGDRPMLEQVLSLFENNSAEKVRKKYQIMQFYRLYLNGDYAACRALYAQVVRNPAYTHTRLDRVQTAFTYGVACRLDGEEEEAVRQFTNVAADGGSTHFAELARHSLNGEVPKDSLPAPDPSFRLPLLERAIRARRIIWSVAAVIYLLIIAAALVFGFQKGNEVRYEPGTSMEG